jgi:hypothetical protein
MSAKKFVETIRQEIIEQNLAHYASMLVLPIEQVTEPRVQAAVNAFSRMDEAQRKAVVGLLRMVLVDTVSNVFGILDGSTLISGFREDFVLTYGADATLLSGDLQDLLLSEEL